MIDKNDWRLKGQEAYLSGKTLYFRKWKSPNSERDHAHCEFCWDKISEYPDTLHQGYTTEDNYYWICQNCYNDFKEMFQWKNSEEERIKEYLDLIIGRPLDDLNLACEMMMFTFGDISLHSQCFTRIMLKERVLLTTLDYQNWDEEVDTNNDEWYNLSRYKDLIINNKVIKTELTGVKDLFICLENDILIQIFISNSSPHYVKECEQWRIFEKGKKEIPHIVIYSEYNEKDE
jgi:hypothetical protein